MEPQLLSLGRESTVYLDVDGSVVKSYRPAEGPFAVDYQRVFGDDCFHVRAKDEKRRRHFFQKEAAILGALSEIDPKLVPGVYGINSDSMAISMGYVPYLTFEQAIMGGGLNLADATAEMVKSLAHFHRTTNGNIDQLIAAARYPGRKTLLRARHPQEQKGRWMNYVRAIVYYKSSEFDEFLEEHGVDRSELPSRRAVNRHIDQFLVENGIDLSSEMGAFIQRDEELTGRERTLVWREAKPQNMFYVPGEEAYFIDFPRVGLGAGSDVDLVSVLYNAHRIKFSPNDDLESVILAKEFFERIGVEDTLVPGRLVRLVASRLKESIRLFANYCQKNPYEIRRLVGRADDVEAARQNGQFKRDFLEENFGLMFSDFFDYYRYRASEGWDLYLEDHDDTRRTELVRLQLESIERIFRRSGVLMGKATSKKREKEARRVMSVGSSIQ